MEQINLPPFFRGQKMIALQSNKDGRIKKDAVYTCAGCDRRKCGCWYVSVAEYPADPSDVYDWDCPDCGIRQYGVNGFNYMTAPSNRFAPVISNFQSISLSEIAKEESKMISVN